MNFSDNGVSSSVKIPHFISDHNGKYKATRALTENQIFSAVKAILKKKFIKGQAFTSPQMAKNYLMFQYANYEHEVFVCIFLDNQHCLFKEVVMALGAIEGASVYPREVVKKALELNAAAVMFAHNHPSGIPTPSPADKLITEKLK